MLGFGDLDNASFQPSPGVTPGWNDRAVGLLIVHHSKFQPSPGVTPGWNRGRRAIASAADVSTLTRGHPRVERQ